MMRDIDTVKLMFGLKVFQLRREQELSYQQLSERTGLAISYLHNIEKGKKYPKTDKIITLAKGLNTSYDYLVSLEPDIKLQPIFELLRSDFMKYFPLELFGIDAPRLIELLAEEPEKINAFISTVLQIIRNYQIRGEDFFQSALRSYQDLHDNYFPELELAVKACRHELEFPRQRAISTSFLESILIDNYGIAIDRSGLAAHQPLRHLRSFYNPAEKRLYLNDTLSTAQENFLLAKEIAFQFLDLSPRPYVTRMLEVREFDELVHNFRASYFAVALLMEEDLVLNDLEDFAAQECWSPQRLIDLLHQYQVTPEVLLQRLANLLPGKWGLRDLFFLRFHTDPDREILQMTKEIHLSQLHSPYANRLNEHYCRRWVSIEILSRLHDPEHQASQPVADAQISEYWGTNDAYLCISLAKFAANDPDGSTSVTLGLHITPALTEKFRFLSDPALPRRQVHTTCERCPIEDCAERMVPPVILEREQQHRAIRKALKVLRENGKVLQQRKEI
ncbi:MAG: helix-turn-helix domain-containing protein [Lewinellaceae bacterium]|nr:helix-turn-helix domain-containing protein [Lewinellaceae bacterium]